MEGINKKYNIELEVLTPLAIGAGAEKDWVKGADFVVKGNRLYKLNLKKMISEGVDLARLSSYFANKDSEGLVQLIGNKLETVSDFNVEISSYSDNDIKVFVKNQLSGNPIIPGSSLKGAVRSILFQYLDGNSKDGKEVFGSSTDGDEFMRFIKVSDAEMDTTNLVNTKIFNLQNTGGWKGGWKHGSSNTNSKFNSTGFNTLYECIMPQQKGYVSLMLSDLLYDNFEQNKKPHIKTEKKRPILQNGIETLFSIINQHTKDYLQKEKAFFQKYSTDKTDSIIKSIDALLDIIPSENSYCILKMSAGSGFHSITGDWQFDDYTINGLDTSKKVSRGLYNNQKSSKSRKIAVWDDNFSLMGFVKLRCLTPEEYSEVEKQRIAKHHEAELKRQQLLKKEKIQREAEEKARKEKEERNNQFQQLLSEVSNLVEVEKYEDAWLKLGCAKEKHPEFKQTFIDEEYLKSKVDEILFMRQQQQRQQQAEQVRLQLQQERVEGGLAKLLDEKYEIGPNIGHYKVTSFKICANKVQSWLKAANESNVPTEQQEVLLRTINRLKNNPDKKEAKSWTDNNSSIWKQISQFVGLDLATQWFNEIV